MKVFSGFTRGKKKRASGNRRTGPGRTLASRVAAKPARSGGGVRRKTRSAPRGKGVLRTLAGALGGGGRHEGFFALVTGVALLALLLGLGVAGAELRAFCRDTDYWQVREVTVHGTQRLPETQVRDTYDAYVQQAGLGTAPNVFDLDLAALRQYLLAQLTGLAEVRVTRQLPGRLTIAVTERVPVALVRLDGQVAYQLDATGTVFPLARPDDCRYPVLTGIDAGQLVLGQPSDLPQVRAALALLAALDPSWGTRLAEINAADPHNLVAYVDGHKLLLGEGGYREKFTALEGLLPQLQGRRVEYINLRSALRPAVKPLGAGAATATH